MALCYKGAMDKTKTNKSGTCQGWKSSWILQFFSHGEKAEIVYANWFGINSLTIYEASSSAGSIINYGGLWFRYDWQIKNEKIYWDNPVEICRGIHGFQILVRQMSPFKIEF